MKRFQECNIIEKIWRRRWCLPLPFQWLWHSWISPIKVYQTEIINDKLVNTDKYDILTNKNLWRLLIGKAQIHMKWMYDHEDVIAKVNKMIENKNSENESINR